MKESLPVKLLDDLENIKGFNRQGFIAVHNNFQSITSIRFNDDKLLKFALIETPVYSQFILNEKVPWCEHGFYLSERPRFTLDPLLHAGAYYVQEPSSMFLHEVLKQTCTNNINKKVLDLCAAPGGKSTLLASYFKDGFVVCNEVIHQRINILYENLTKWGSSNIVITNNDAADFKRLENYFDVLVVDAPCSGSGLFRKDADAIDEWSTNNVMLCSQRQQRILSDIYNSVKQNGILIYSTCSYSQQENEDILDWIHDNLNMESIQLKLNSEWNITETQSPKYKAYGYRFWPHRLKGEGFFITALKKMNGTSLNHTSKKNILNKSANKHAGIASNYIENNDWFFFNQKENIKVIHSKWAEDIGLLQKHLHIRKAGIDIGKIVKDNLVPHHELALSIIIKNTIPQAEFLLDEALQYLRKKEVFSNNNCKGWVLSSYKNYPLGWLKFLHNRINNYYPINWRILKD